MTPASTQGLRGRRASFGFTLVELMIAMVLGLILVNVFLYVYQSSRTATRRVEQLSTLQQSVRTAFDYLTNDAHAVGMVGCFTGSGPLSSNVILPAARNLTNNYGPWVEGFDAATVPSYPLAAASAPSSWNANNTATATVGSGRGIDVIPFATLGTDVALGSDVLVLRTVVGRPLRIRADVNPALTPTQCRFATLAAQAIAVESHELQTALDALARKDSRQWPVVATAPPTLRSARFQACVPTATP